MRRVGKTQHGGVLTVYSVVNTRKGWFSFTDYYQPFRKMEFPGLKYEIFHCSAGRLKDMKNCV